MTVLIDAQHVAMSRPGKPLFDGVSVAISTGDRIGIVGLNGTGKSTLIDVLLGTRLPESGNVLRSNGLRVSALDQNPDLGEGTIDDLIETIDAERWEVESALDRLGMAERGSERVDQLSGGERKRVALARALVAESDLLVLDEPTNHLDVAAIEWLESQLGAYRGGLILVTHDRHVLDKVTTRVLELDRGSAFVHEGGYDAYLEGRARREEEAAKAETVRKNLAKTELAWLRRGAPARTSKAKARIRSATELVEARPQEQARQGSLDLHFGTPRLGNDTIDLDGVSFGYPGHQELFSGVELSLDRRERLGIVGANGAGKSTLLDIIAGRRTPTTGIVRVGPTVKLELFDQRGVELNPAKRVWETVVGDAVPKPDWRDKALMESFWFDADAQYAPVELLSGGERRRLQLLITLARQPNILLLDEPTNDLDLDTLRVLEDFLETFPGAVVVVSHDRAFLERTVDDVVILDGVGSASRLPGGYEAYDNMRREDSRSTSGHRTSSLSRSTTSPDGVGTARVDDVVDPGVATRRSSSTVRHELKAVERRMAKLEKARARLSEDLETSGDDHEALTRIGSELADIAGELSDVEENWLELTEELDG